MFLLQIHATAPAAGAEAQPPFNVLIDCGKTFRTSCLNTLIPLGVRSLDVVLLTHGHADAILGLDDLREFSSVERPIAVYSDGETQEALRRTFGYLFPRPDVPASALWVAAVDWRLYYGDATRAPQTLLEGRVVMLELGGQPWPIGVFQVWHGDDTPCNAYVFPLSAPDNATASPLRVLVYMSDVSVVGDREVRSIQSLIAQLSAIVGEDRALDADSIHLEDHLEVLVLDMDMLRPLYYISHLGFHSALLAARLLHAQKTYFVGLSHSLEYRATNALIGETVTESGGSGTMELGWDGCVVWSR
jgi:phosphoribosyl 1,2-cyclic phosphodiesterase